MGALIHRESEDGLAMLTLRSTIADKEALKHPEGWRGVAKGEYVECSMKGLEKVLEKTKKDKASLDGALKEKLMLGKAWLSQV